MYMIIGNESNPVCEQIFDTYEQAMTYMGCRWDLSEIKDLELEIVEL